MNGFDPNLPYNELPLLGDRSELKDKNTDGLCQQIMAALSQVRIAYQALPCKQAVMAIIPLGEALVNGCPLNEPPKLVSLTRHASLDLLPNNQNLYSSLRFHRALLYGQQAIKQRHTCTATATEVARIISGEEIMIRRGYGPPLLRGSRRQVAYQPPVGESLLRSYLGNWETFLHERADLHPLVRMAAGLFQFIAISPFHQANLRSAHILCQLYLTDKGLLPAPILGLSAYWLKYRRTYEDLFLNIHYRGQWKEWLDFILNAVLHQARHTETRLHDFRQVWVETHRTVDATLPRGDKRELTELLMQRPYCATMHLVDAGIAQRQTASNYLKKLRDAGLLREKPSGREKYYLHQRLLHLIEHDPLSHSA